MAFRYGKTFAVTAAIVFIMIKIKNKCKVIMLSRALNENANRNELLEQGEEAEECLSEAELVNEEMNVSINQEKEDNLISSKVIE